MRAWVAAAAALAWGCSGDPGQAPSLGTNRAALTPSAVLSPEGRVEVQTFASWRAAGAITVAAGGGVFLVRRDNALFRVDIAGNILDPTGIQLGPGASIFDVGYVGSRFLVVRGDGGPQNLTGMWVLPDGTTTPTGTTLYGYGDPSYRIVEGGTGFATAYRSSDGLVLRRYGANAEDLGSSSNPTIEGSNIAVTGDVAYANGWYWALYVESACSASGECTQTLKRARIRESDGVLLDPRGIVVRSVPDPDLSILETDLACTASTCLATWMEWPLLAGATKTLRGQRFSSVTGSAIDASPVTIATGDPKGHPSIGTDGTHFVVASRLFGDARVIPVPAAGPFTPVTIGELPGPDTSQVQIAFQGGKYLAVGTQGWQGLTLPPVARFFSADGTPGAPLDIAEPLPTNAQGAPAVASARSHYLVAWEDGRGPRGQEMVCVRVKSDGTVLDVPAVVLPHPDGADFIARGSPQVAALDGDRYVVAWKEQFDGGLRIRAVRLAGDGTLEDPVPLVVAETNPPVGMEDFAVVRRGNTAKFYYSTLDQKTSDWKLELQLATVTAQGSVVAAAPVKLDVFNGGIVHAIEHDGERHLVVYGRASSHSPAFFYDANDVSTSANLPPDVARIEWGPMVKVPHGVVFANGSMFFYDERYQIARQLGPDQHLEPRLLAFDGETLYESGAIQLNGGTTNEYGLALVDRDILHGSPVTRVDRSSLGPMASRVPGEAMMVYGGSDGRVRFRFIRKQGSWGYEADGGVPQGSGSGGGSTVGRSDAAFADAGIPPVDAAAPSGGGTSNGGRVPASSGGANPESGGTSNGGATAGRGGTSGTADAAVDIGGDRHGHDDDGCGVTRRRGAAFPRWISLAALAAAVIRRRRAWQSTTRVRHSP